MLVEKGIQRRGFLVGGRAPLPFSPIQRRKRKSGEGDFLLIDRASSIYGRSRSLDSVYLEREGRSEEDRLGEEETFLT